MIALLDRLAGKPVIAQEVEDGLFMVEPLQFISSQHCYALGRKAGHCGIDKSVRHRLPSTQKGNRNHD